MQHQVCAVKLLIKLPLGTSASVSDSIWNYLCEKGMDQGSFKANENDNITVENRQGSNPRDT